MKRIIPLIYMLVIGLTAMAQEEAEVTHADINRFFNTKTMIISNDHSMSTYFMEIKKKAELHWTITEYEFITDEQYDEMYEDPNLSFLMITQGVFKYNKKRVAYNFLTVLIGTPGARNIKEMKILARIPLSYHKSYEENWVYTIGTAMNFLQKHLQRCKADPDLLEDEIYKSYTDSDTWKDLKGKTIWVDKEDLSKKVDTEKEIKETYPGEVKITTQEEIEKAIDNYEDVLYVHVIKPENTKVDDYCFKIVMGAKDAEMYYFDYHEIDPGDGEPAAMLEDDFNVMRRMVDPSFLEKIFY